MIPRRAHALALTLTGLVAAGCSPREKAQDVEFRVPVTVRDVTTAAVEDRVVATGTLRAPESVALRADTSGALVVARGSTGRRLVEGDPVRAGQLIAEITGEEVKLAARTDSTRQRYETTLRDFESQQRLFEQGLLSEMEFRRAEATLSETRLELDRSLLTEQRSRLITPIDGVVLRLARDASGLPLGEGQLVVQGYEVAQVAPISTLVADVDLVGSDVSRVQAALPARIRHHAWDSRTFEGRVERLSPTLDPATRTLRAEVRVDNGERLLRPGMFVEVTIVTERRELVPVVPREAVTERAGAKVVFVLDGQRVARREVVLGLGDDETVEIRQGVKPGERVVVRGLETLTDGTRVRPSGA